MDADYSSALTLLLRYPVPSAPNGPVTLVQDAFYLRENLSVKGGKHIVLKYSGRSPTDSAGLGGPTSQRRSMHPSQYNSDELDRAKSPLRSPSQFLLEWGGIEGIFQEAVLAPAKGVYKQSEKWGLNQALRAVQGLQSGTNSPRRSTSNARWSLDEGKHVPSSIDQFQSQLKTLEHRNKTIAKMLNKVTGEFLERAKRLEDDSNEDISGWISIIGAKLQFIHVYLNDSTLPLDATGSSEAGEEGTDSGLSTTNHPGRMHKRSLRERRADTSAVTPDRSSLVRGDLDGNEDPEQQEPPSETGRAPNTNSGQNTAATTAQETSQPLVIKDPPENDNKATASNTTSSKTDETTPRNSIERPGHRQQRASLSQSSFAWMLAENKQGSSVEPSASSPLSPRKDRKGRPKGKTGYLFGEEGDDDAS